jgi:hypothetical protein
LQKTFILKKLVRILFFSLLLLTFPFRGKTQTWYETSSFHLTYSGTSHDENLRHIFNLLAFNNNCSVLSLQINLSFQTQFNLSTSPSGIPVLRYAVMLRKISGNTRFRDFHVDTLLVPEKAEVMIHVYKNQQLVDTLYQTIDINREQVFIPVSEKTPVSSLYITFQMKQIRFTSHNLKRFVRCASEINHYYGYRKIMKELPLILTKTNDIHLIPSSVFVNYLALSRLSYDIRSHHFPSFLHLNKKDPVHFQRIFAAVQRKQIRMKTLSDEILNGQDKPPASDNEAFARAYTALSVKAVMLAGEQQPFTAASFTEYASVPLQKTDKNFILQVAGYYQQYQPQDVPAVYQKIYKNFIEDAAFYTRQKKYVTAIDFLTNARVFESAFPAIKPVYALDTLLVTAHDGLAFSYLKVARIALKRGDKTLSEQYIQRALAGLHYKTGNALPAALPCYRNTAQQFIQLSLMAMQSGNNIRALNLLFHAHNACPQDAKTDSLHRIICQHLLAGQQESIKTLLRLNQPLRAADSLEKMAVRVPLLCRENPDSVRKKQLSGMADMIFEQLLEEGSNTNQDIRQTMRCLKSALTLQKNFYLPSSSRLYSLIRKAATPYILALAAQARMAVWQRNFVRADSLYRQVRQLAVQYRVNRQLIVNQTLTALRKEIKNSGCQWKQVQIKQLLQNTRNDIKAYRLTRAESNFLKAKKWYKAHPDCPVNDPEIDSLFTLYTQVFQFIHAYHAMTQQLFNKGFSAVVQQYAQLDAQYRKASLSRFSLPFVPLLSFVQKQHSDEITLTAMRYFIRQKDFSTALKYLLVLKNPAKAKTEQKQIAAGYVSKKQIPKKAILDNPDFSVFSKAYFRYLEERKIL